MDFYSNLPAAAAGVEPSIYPTLFEILSSNEIDELLTPSVRYIVANFVARNPNRYSIKLTNWFDEWFTLLTKFVIEQHHLKHWNSTFIEKFYGLRRINAKNKLLLNVLKKSPSVDLTLPLTKVQSSIVLFEKVIVPYIAIKLDFLHNNLLATTLFQTEDSNTIENTSIKDRIVALLRRLFIKYYPTWKKLVFALNLVIRISFLSGKIGSTSFLDYLFGIEFTRLTEHDYKRNATVPISSTKSFNRPQRTNGPMIRHFLGRSFSIASQLVQYSGSQLFPAFIFVLRVFQWWTAQDLSTKLQRKLDDIDKDIPPPPLPYESKEGNCGICHDAIQNPAAIETGYVFCYPCILKFLPENEGKCPITKCKLLGCQFDQDTGQWSITGVRKLLL